MVFLGQIGHYMSHVFLAQNQDAGSTFWSNRPGSALRRAPFSAALAAIRGQRSPAVLVASLAIQDNQGALLLESRRLGRTSPLLIAYRSVIECGVLTGEPEAPTFSEIVPDNIAAAAGDMWTNIHDTSTRA